MRTWNGGVCLKLRVRGLSTRPQCLVSRPDPLSPWHTDPDTHYLGPTIRYEASKDGEISVLTSTEI